MKQIIERKVGKKSIYIVNIMIDGEIVDSIEII